VELRQRHAKPNCACRKQQASWQQHMSASAATHTDHINVICCCESNGKGVSVECNVLDNNQSPAAAAAAAAVVLAG
jgi:hypothetical protein